jgi:molecular chaperone DnaK
MNNTINFGIDLGTTNSAIAKFVKGEVIVFNNPLDYGRATLPSIVSYRKDKITVGSKAKEYLEKDPKSVVGTFKRKMGTTESFQIKSLNESKTPIELSAQVLKELKTFVNTDDTLDAVVITVPASFDLIQSNATKEAGKQAGFKQVVLLQEPIAASLAYANMKKTNDLTNGQWLVYDWGGGTFDVALVKIFDGEMKIIDHEGNNFLGGTDFDQLIVEKLIIPKLNAEYSFEKLEEDLKSASGRYNAKYYILLRRVEEVKIRLSAVSSAEIVVDGFEDEDGNDVDVEISITRTEFNDLIKPAIDETIEMIKKILVRNSLTPIELQFNLMVGGSTYIPYVRQRVEEILQIPVNCEIDPTTAVAVGAAYYAATKQKEISKSEKEKKKTSISVKTAYNKTSKEKEELFSIRIKGNTEGLFYKITRQDGGFDSGLKKLAERINEDLPLVDNAFNYFSFIVYDHQNNVIETDVETISINSGFGINGQPLPEDICLEVDDYDNPGETRLSLVFKRNTVLPTKRTLTFPLNKTVIKGSTDEVIVNVMQGSYESLPASNKTLGHISITGKNLTRDVSKGSDIEITVSLSESQDLTVSAYLNMSNQEFKGTFNPKERHTSIKLLKEQVDDLSKKLEEEISQASEREEYETAIELNKLQKEMEEIAGETESLSLDDVTDKKYQLEDKKRKLAQEIDSATKNKRIDKAKEEYFETKTECENLLNEDGNDHERKAFDDIVSQEKAFFATRSPIKIQEKTDELDTIVGRIKWRTPKYLLGIFNWLLQKQPKMNDRVQAKSLFEAGHFAVSNKNWERLREINFGLMDLLPHETKDEVRHKIGFGL